MPLGPSAGSVARYTLASAPSVTERNPLLRLRSVFVYPGLAALTLIGVLPLDPVGGLPDRQVKVDRKGAPRPVRRNIYGQGGKRPGRYDPAPVLMK